MLHELLSALFGYGGPIFRIEGKHIGVDSGLALHPSERCVLDRLCHLAAAYSTLDNFIKQNSRHLPSYKNASMQKMQETPLLRFGVYLENLCMSLDRVLLAYREDLLTLESEILENKCITATYIQSKLEHYQILLPALTRLTNEIKETSSHGCQILDVAHKHSASGIPIVNSAIKKILKAGHVTLLKQLQEWLLQGILFDKYEELFIKSQLVDSSLGSISNFPQDQPVTLGQIVSDSGLNNPTQEVTYSLRAEMLPSYISVQFAEVILFIGVSVALFKRKPGSGSHPKESTLGNREQEFSQNLAMLAKGEEFNLRALEEQVSVIKQALGKHLRDLLEKHGLREHLKDIKDFYLLGRGELFLAFIDQADHLLRVPHNRCVITNIRAAFGASARSVLLDEEILQHFECNVNSQRVGNINPEMNFGGSSKEHVTGWDCIELKYNPDWPLSILFTASVQERYNCILQFLLRVRRVQLHLHKCWALQMPCNTHSQLKSEENFRLSSLWHLRSCMAFLIDNLQYYLQVDVIESQHSVLMSKIKSMDFYDDIQLAHGYFLATVMAQTFISMKPVSQSLREVFNLCESFCNLLEQFARAPQATIFDEVSEYSKQFFLQTSLLLRTLSSIRSHQASPHLGQLLMRIDFNKYFSNMTT